MVKVAAFSVALVGYVFLIGWMVTWVRLSAARLPVDASLPLVDDKIVFTTGLRTVLLMAVVFAAMCAVAYLTHAWTWTKRAPEWHAVVSSGRAKAAADPTLNPPGQQIFKFPKPRIKLTTPKLSALKPQGPPTDLHPDPIGDPFVRVLAGFNVVVLGAAFGLAGARIIQPLIEQIGEIEPGQWWSLLAPWGVLSAVAIWIFTLIGPLRGGRWIHTILWAVVIAVAMLSTAPLGLLILTWAGIATLGRLFGRRHSRPRSKVEFVLSPMPWILLTIYALVGLAYYAVPPVSFSDAVVTTASGTMRSGGYLARTGAGVYLVSCTPLADATSTDEAVSVIPAGDVRGVLTGGPTFSVDSGRPPSLPTLALHAFGIEASTPTWIQPQLRATRATCAGSQPPSPSVGYEAPQLGLGVIAGSPPPGASANDGEAPIEQTTRGIAQLARRFQPTLLVTVADRFWPVSVGALLADLGSGGKQTCLHRALQKACALSAPKLTDLQPQGSNPDDFLQFPPGLDPDPTGQFNAFVRGQQGVQTAVPTLHGWLRDPGLLNVWNSAQVYFYDAGRAHPSSWPVPNKQIPDGRLIALQYWFFYPYNYYPTATTADLMNDAPLAADVVNTDLHQGDWEHITVLVDPKTKTAKWVYMARHSHEGQYFSWNSPRLSFDQGHVVVQAAFGGHPSYDAHCGARLRFIPPLDGRVSDWVVCGSGRFAFRAATTPLVDIATAPWACWKGHFGVASATELSHAKQGEGTIQRAIDANYYVAGPRSPLWQAENGRLAADGAAKDTGFCANNGDPRAPGQAAIRSGLGSLAPGLVHTVGNRAGRPPK
jgi:Vacuolar protein sorting-associated protein 62